MRTWESGANGRGDLYQEKVGKGGGAIAPHSVPSSSRHVFKNLESWAVQSFKLASLSELATTVPSLGCDATEEGGESLTPERRM